MRCTITLKMAVSMLLMHKGMRSGSLHDSDFVIMQGHHGAAGVFLSHEAGIGIAIPDADTPADLRHQLHAIVFSGHRPLQGHS